jgi:HMG (high mobility group) box protein
MAAPIAAARAARVAKRVYPLAAAAYNRWQALSDEEKERYKQRARAVAERGQAIGKDALARAQKARGGARRKKR